jgi:hypothetical protein
MKKKKREDGRIESFRDRVVVWKQMCAKSGLQIF